MKNYKVTAPLFTAIYGRTRERRSENRKLFSMLGQFSVTGVVVLSPRRSVFQ